MKTLKKSFGLLIILSLSIATLSLQSCGEKKEKTIETETTSSSKSDASTSDSKTEATSEKSSGGSSSCSQIAEDYGKFVDEYVSILKKYTKDPTNTAILADYTTYIQKLEKVTSNLDANKDCNSDMTFMAEILKHNQRMATAATQK